MDKDKKLPFLLLSGTNEVGSSFTYQAHWNLMPILTILFIVLLAIKLMHLCHSNFLEVITIRLQNNSKLTKVNLQNPLLEM